MKQLHKIYVVVVFLLFLSGCDICGVDSLKSQADKLLTDNTNLQNQINKLKTENSVLNEKIKELDAQVKQKKSNLNKLFN